MSPPSLNRQMIFVAVVLCIAAASPAYAQATGGAFLGPFLSWLQENVLPTVSTFAVIALGLMMAAAHCHLLTILACCGGLWVATNASMLVGLLHG